MLPLFLVLSICIFLYLYIQQKKQDFVPQSDTYKTLQNIKKKQEKKEKTKHQYISDQLSYIETQWGYTQTQKKVIIRCLEERSYREMYNKLTASLLPQIIMLIDSCNERGQKGCKREVSRRIAEMVEFVRAESKRYLSQKKEDFETTLEVYDALINEIK